MRALTRWVLSTFASPAGIVILAALDSTLFFSLPFGIDAAVILLAARSETLAWTVPLLAAGGSLAGGALTFWMGRKIGEAGLERYVSAARVARARSRARQKRGAVALALLSLIPPPFPFSPFMLAGGALGIRATVFFVIFALARLVRFGIEAFLAVRYGRAILRWMESDWIQTVVFCMIVLAAILTGLSVVRLIRSSRGRSAAPKIARA
jgi:membrane protein YqaA with SNARE-associated domain